MSSREHLRRETIARLRSEAQRSLSSFVSYCGEHQPATHHQVLCTALQMVVQGQISRAMVFMPPGAAKSTYCSVYAPSWALGKVPGINLISASHTQALSDDFGRRTRGLIETERYREIFPVETARDNRSVRSYSVVPMFGTEKQRRVDTGVFRAAGVGVGIAGRRADVALIDDPFRSREDADSPVIREKNWNWYLADLRTRLKPNGRIVIVNTRWHEDDICGRILPEGYNGESGWVRARDGEWWFVIAIQAIAERDDDILGRAAGESYWPGWYTQPMLEQERTVQTPRNWSALYQQRPSPEEGDYYKREWFQWYDELPKHCRFYGASDYAVTADGGDFTVHLVGAAHGPAMLEDLYLADYWTGQTASDVWIQQFIDFVLAYHPIEWGEEQGQISKSLGPTLDLEQQRNNAWCYRSQMSVAGDKAQRGQSFRALAAQRRVYLPRNSAWAKDFLDRLLRFPNTSRDDDHDAAGLLARLVYGMRGGKEKPGKVVGPAPGTFDHLLHITDAGRFVKKSIYRGR